MLQEDGLWRYAATLTAHKLEGVEHALSCLRWAQHVQSQEGSIWRAAGILVSGGCLREAIRVTILPNLVHRELMILPADQYQLCNFEQVFKNAGYPDCAAAFCECCKEAGLMRTEEDSVRDDRGEVHEQLFDALSTTQFTRHDKRGQHGQRRLATSEEEQEALVAEIKSDFVVYCKRLMSVF